MAGILEQAAFFQKIRERIPSHLSMVDELEDLLSISTDSAYRRIRGEKELSFSELQKIALHFNVSADLALNSTTGDEIYFKYKPIDEEKFNLLDYTTNAYQIVKKFADSGNCEMIYAAKDMPIFHDFYNDELAAFKTFVWQKTILGFRKFENRKFSLSNLDSGMIQTGKKLLAEYIRFPSTELWNEETIQSTLLQIEYYAESGLFENPKEAFIVLGKLEEYITHIKSQAEKGLKFLIGDAPSPYSGSFKLYHNEVVLSDNTVLAILEDQKVSFITHNAFNFLSTSNDRFCDASYKHFLNLMSRSSLISKDSEKLRNKFFSGLAAEIKKTREKLEYLIR